MVQVKEDGKSECPMVIVGIGVNTSMRKHADFHLVLYYEKVVVNF